MAKAGAEGAKRIFANLSGKRTEFMLHLKARKKGYFALNAYLPPSFW